MSDYRVYSRGANFDGATAEVATYTQSRFLYTTTANPDDLVGVFGPSDLGRTNVVSAVQVVFGAGINTNDWVRVLDSSGNVRTEIDAVAYGAPWLMLEPDDSLALFSASRSARIIINDLTDEQLQQWILSSITQSSQVAPDYPTPITTAANTTISAWTGGIQFVNTTGALNQTITLPPYTDVEVGDELWMYNASANAHNIAAAAGQTINGAAFGVITAGSQVRVGYNGTQWIGLIS